MAQILCIGVLCASGLLGNSNHNNNNNNRNQNYESFEYSNRRPSLNNNNYNNQQNNNQQYYNQPSQQNFPDSPCLYFEYVTNNNGDTEGRISFQTPQDSNINLHLELSLGARLSVRNIKIILYL